MYITCRLSILYSNSHSNYISFEATIDKIRAFRPGHRMVIGSPTLRSPPATGGKSILDLANGTPQPIQRACSRSNTTEPLLVSRIRTVMVMPLHSELTSTSHPATIHLKALTHTKRTCNSPLMGTALKAGLTSL